MHECINGYISAARLLGNISKNKASEYDYRQLEEYEERLKLLGFGNFQDVQGTSNDGQLPPKLGDITRNLIAELMTKAGGVQSGHKELLYEYDEQLCLAGFGDHYDAAKTQFLADFIMSYVPNLFGKRPSEIVTEPLETSNNIPEEVSRKPEIRPQASLSRVGLLTAVNLLYELGMGHTSDVDLRKLGEYEDQLKEARKAGKYNQWTPGLGITTNNFLTELAEQLANTEDREMKNLIIEEYEEQLQLAGFGDHYDSSKIGELQEDFDNLRMVFEDGLDEVQATDTESEVESDVSTDTEEQLKLAAFGQHSTPIKMEDLRKELENLGIDQNIVSSDDLVEHSTEELLKSIGEALAQTNEVQAQTSSEVHYGWYCTDLSPPPEFNGFYARLYSDLPLSCKAYAFTEHLKYINNFGKFANYSHEEILHIYSKDITAFDKYLSILRIRDLIKMKKDVPHYGQKQKDWRSSIIAALLASKDRLPAGFSPLDIYHPLTVRASAVAIRLKMIEIKLGKADAKQAVLLSKEFADIAASFDMPFHCPIPGEPYVEPARLPLPSDLEQLKQSKNRALKEYKQYPSPLNKQVLLESSNQFRRRMTSYKKNALTDMQT